MKHAFFKFFYLLVTFCGANTVFAAEPDDCESRIAPKDQEVLSLARKPQYFESTNVHIKGERTKRLMIVFRSNGCAFKRKTDGKSLKNQVCRHCNFNLHAIAPASHQVTASDQLYQFENVINRYEAMIEEGVITQLDLLTSGNFVNPEEFSTELWESLIAKANQYARLQKIVLEGRAEYITRDRVEYLRQISREDLFLEFSIGVESTNIKTLRFLRKGFSAAMFMEAIAAISSQKSTGLHVNLLFKPRPGLKRKEAIRELVVSALDVLRVSKGLKTRIAIHPMFIAPQTYIEELFNNGTYTLPDLNDLPLAMALIVKMAASFGLANLNSIFAGLSDEELSNGRNTVGKKSRELYEDIQEFNGSQNLVFLNKYFEDAEFNDLLEELSREYNSRSNGQRVLNPY